MGNYRGHVKAPRRLGMNPRSSCGPASNHWEKLRSRGLQEAPDRGRARRSACVTFAVGRKSGRLDELHVAGALVGALRSMS